MKIERRGSALSPLQSGLGSCGLSETERAKRTKPTWSPAVFSPEAIKRNVPEMPGINTLWCVHHDPGGFIRIKCIKKGEGMSKPETRLTPTGGVKMDGERTANT